MPVQFYRRTDLDSALNLAGSFPSYAKVTLKAAGVTRDAKYEVAEDYQWATLLSKAEPNAYNSEYFRKQIEKREEKLFLVHAEFYDVEVKYGK